MSAVICTPAIRACALRCLAAIAIASVTAAASSIAAPTKVVAEYDVMRNGTLVAKIHETFERRDGAYVIRSETRGVGMLALFRRSHLSAVSRGKIVAAGLQPEHFERTRGGDVATRASAEFDWGNQQLTLNHEGKRVTAPLAPGLQDRLSAMYQFMFTPLEGRSELRLSVTNGAKLDRYTYDVRSGEAIDTALGAMRSVRLIRRREAGDSGAEIWLATERAHLPARMLVLETDGDRLEQSLTRLDIVD